MILPSKKGPEAPSPPSDPFLSQEELRRRVSRVRYDLTTGEPIPYPPLNSAEDVPAWAQRVEESLREVEIPEEQWSDAAVLFLEDPSVSIEMRRLRDSRLNEGVKVWDWEELQEALYELLDQRGFIQRFREDHPTAVKVAGAGLVIAGGSVLGPAALVSGLNGVGFTSAGIAASSWAATIQSAVYGGATTGLFSMCQSIGATAVPATTGTVLSAIGSVAAGVGLIKKGGGSGGSASGETPKEGSTTEDVDVYSGLEEEEEDWVDEDDEDASEAPSSESGPPPPPQYNA